MDNVIELDGVRKTFRDFWLRPTVAAVDGLTLSVPRGEVFGLLGPNGSGKSTTIKMILGLLDPSAGRVSLFGRSPRSLEARRRLGYLPELSYLHPFLTARETLVYYAGLCGLGRREAAERRAEPADGADAASDARGGDANAAAEAADTRCRPQPCLRPPAQVRAPYRCNAYRVPSHRCAG